LRNHAPDIAAMDLLVVPTIGFDVLYALVIVRLRHRSPETIFRRPDKLRPAQSGVSRHLGDRGTRFSDLSVWRESMIGDGFQSDTAARFAGRQALADFLSDLLKEEKRK
jgi:hypothetical protein